MKSNNNYPEDTNFFQNRSLKWQLTLLVMGIITVILVVSYICVNFLMEQFFIRENKKHLIEINYSMEKLLDYFEGSSDRAFFVIDENVDNLYDDIVNKCSAHSVSMSVFTDNGKFLMTMGNFNKGSAEKTYSRYMSRNTGNTDIIEKNDEYLLQIYNDHDLDKNYLELIGRHGSYVVIMKTDLLPIRKNIDIFNQLLAYIYLSIIPIAFFVIWYVSSKITKPIDILTDITERMISLDFETQLMVDEKNEIGMLADNINKLSEVLERTICKLRTANSILSYDLQKKKDNENRLNEFVSDLSHELKTPISLIQGYAEGLKEFLYEDDSDRREFYCDVIIDESHRMNRMLRQLINLNYLELDFSQVEMEKFDLNHMTRNIISAYYIRDLKNQVELIFQPQQPIINVFGDLFKIEEVITNYITNAIDHVEDVDGTGKRIRIDIYQVENKARFEVFNTGKHIPVDDLQRIWEKFFKVDRARSRKFGGSGIGLSIVQAIMNLHDQKYGAVNYENGVMFFFELDLTP